MSNLCVIACRSSGSLRRGRAGASRRRRLAHPCGLLGVLRRVERLRALAAVAVDRDALRPAATTRCRPADLLDGRVLRHVHRLADRARDERLHGAHHPDVPHVVDRPLAARRLERAVEHRQVRLLQVRRALDRLVLVDVLDDLLDLLRRVAQLLSAIGTVWLTIFIRPPPTSFLYLTSAMSGSTPVVSQSIMKPIVPGRREHGRLRVAVAVLLAELDGLVPRLPAPPRTGPSARAPGRRP
jgi:hypothetical protein